MEIEITDRPTIQKRFWILEDTFVDEKGNQFKGILDIHIRKIEFVRGKDAESICSMLNGLYDSCHPNEHGREWGARVVE